MQKQTVFILHDHEIGWAAVRATLRGRDDAQFVGDVTSHDAALRIATQHQIDLILASDFMDGVSSQATLAALHSACPAARIALFVSEVSVAALASFGQLELAACCGWEELHATEALTTVLDAVLTGDLFVGTRNAAAAYFYNAACALISGISPVELSLQDQHILVLLARGFTSREIADQISRAPHTVENRLMELRARLGARNSPHLIHLAHRYCLLHPRDDDALADGASL
jgi:two-component system response regulator NreC